MEEAELGLIPEESLKSKKYAVISAVSLLSVVILMLVNDILRLKGGPHIEEIGFIPFLSCLGDVLLHR